MGYKLREKRGWWEVLYHPAAVSLKFPVLFSRAYGRLASPWAQARPGLGLGLGLGLGRGPGLCPREPIEQLPNNY